jgi:hypothetical protein
MMPAEDVKTKLAQFFPDIGPEKRLGFGRSCLYHARACATAGRDNGDCPQYREEITGMISELGEMEKELDIPWRDTPPPWQHRDVIEARILLGWASDCAIIANAYGDCPQYAGRLVEIGMRLREMHDVLAG